REAACAWRLHLRERAGSYLSPERLFNGSFETEPAGSVFDWRITQSGGVHAARERTRGASGDWALRIDFERTDGEEAYCIASQKSVVQAGAYLFRAMVRTPGAISDAGVGFRLRDAEDPDRFNISLAARSSGNSWTELKRPIRIPAGTELLELLVVREPALELDGAAAGTAWIDAVTLQPR
ncbi:MAG: hypothetical protein M1436_02230, partial [Acidobacteria bacterium]|nr:hypothetical protein [Acidobacteriota bacterium]